MENQLILSTIIHSKHQAQAPYDNKHLDLFYFLEKVWNSWRVIWQNIIMKRDLVTKYELWNAAVSTTSLNMEKKKKSENYFALKATAFNYRVNACKVEEWNMISTRLRDLDNFPNNGANVTLVV